MGTTGRPTSGRSGVVVGVDSGASADSVLRFAAGQARLRHLPVAVVRAWEPYAVVDGAVLFPGDDQWDAEAAVLRAAQDRLEQIAPGLPSSVRLVRGPPDRVLVDASAGADLLVLGSHGDSAARLGPVLGRVPTRSHCPVVAVPPDRPGATGGAQGTDVGAPSGVVVGADGSAMSSEAVGFAFAQASRWGCPLTAVLAAAPPSDAYLPEQRRLGQVSEEGERALAEQLTGWPAHPDVVVRHVVSLDGPLPALLAASAGARLLVVGSHGRGALLRAALGSVSDGLLRSAPCPVAVVRSPRPPARADAHRAVHLAAAVGAGPADRHR